MTKFLSQALQAPEPFFRRLLQRLEAANGHPSTDIRFSTELQQSAKNKLRELGLDPEDTTPEELYHALQERVRQDDDRLNRQLRTLAATHVSAEADVVAGMVHALQSLPDAKRCFALKASALKALLKNVPPKKAMKALGYRSLDSFLKHESPVSALTASRLCEDSHWHKRLLDQYKQLTAGDFENRSIQIIELTGGRWRDLAQRAAAERQTNLVCFKEFGALVFLPLPADAPHGSTIASLGLALHELNEIRAGSTFLKLCQVRPDFGDLLKSVAGSDEPRIRLELLDQATPWRLIQRYYANLAGNVKSEVSEPHLQLEDIAWQPLGESLKNIDPALAFWGGSAHLGLLREGVPVSMHVLDAALNLCNHLPFERRLSRYFQDALHSELMLRYLQPDTVERAVSGQVQPQLALAEEVA